MTLTDYLNQEDPQRLPSGFVELQDSEVTVLSQITIGKVFKYWQVLVYSLNAVYIIVEGSNVLRTTDQDGNPKGYSCFSYDIPKES